MLPLRSLTHIHSSDAMLCSPATDALRILFKNVRLLSELSYLTHLLRNNPLLHNNSNGRCSDERERCTSMFIRSHDKKASIGGDSDAQRQIRRLFALMA